MGAGASVYSVELSKPIDGSDVDASDPNAAKNEVIRLRKLLRDNQTRSQPVYTIQTDGNKTCVERIQSALAAITSLDVDLNSCVEVLAESALQQATEADASLAKLAERRPLEGVPIVVKINIDVVGSLSTASMPGLAEWRPATTAPLAQRLIDAGCIVVAKTNMPEAALGCWGFSPVHGITKNPLNAKYTTSGSSSGTAAAIAAGIVKCGLGSDTGGSLRMPAECCGIVGLRPSRDRYPGTGVIPCNIQWDRAGAMAIDVKNLSLLDSVMAGESTVDSQLAADLKGLGVAVASGMYAAAVPGHQQALDTAVRALEESGATVTTKEIKFKEIGKDFLHENDLDFREQGLDEYLASHSETCTTTTDEVLAKSFYKLIEGYYKEPKSHTGKLVNAKSSTKEDIIKFQQELAVFNSKYEKFFADHNVDVVLTPVCHGTPPLCLSNEEYQSSSNAFKTFSMAVGPSAGACLFNNLSAPSLAMPTPAMHKEIGMPAGILLWGKPNDDRRLIQIGIALENAFAAGLGAKKLTNN